MVDPNLIEKLNSGRCFVLVGSGLSTEIGYPSWTQLASRLMEHLETSLERFDSTSYKAHLEKGEFPELFSQAQEDLGGRDALVTFIREQLRPPTGPKKSSLYDVISRWPFACYLTTNWDDELSNRLRIPPASFATVGNTPADLQRIRADSRGLIVKLHGDLVDPTTAVITSEDYHQFESFSSRQYFRDKLRQIVELFDLVILGHSLSDADLKLVMKIAKETADPAAPIYLFAPDVTQSTIREYRQRYNIKVTSYSNGEGDHRRLGNLLRSIDRFIVSRSGAPVAITTSKDDADAATALFLYRRMNLTPPSQVVDPKDYLGPLIIQAMGADGIVDSEALLLRAPLRQLSNSHPQLHDAIADVLSSLVEAGRVYRDGSVYKPSAESLLKQDEASLQRRELASAAFEDFCQQIRKEVPDITEPDLKRAVTAMEAVIVGSFRKRGLALASSIFSGISTDSSTLSELYKQAASVAETLGNETLRAPLVAAAHQFLIVPTAKQAEYLEAVSQGFFLFHLVGCDPRCNVLRRDLFSKTLWLVDSNVILPAVAKSCVNHEYAIDLFTRLVAQQAQIYVTHKILREVFDHIRWARQHTPTNATTSLDFMDEVLATATASPNLFVDGFVRMSVNVGVAEFDEYLGLVLGGPLSFERLEALVRSMGIQILTEDDASYAVIEDVGERADLEAIIKEQREAIGRYKSVDQVEAEAEILQLLKSIRGNRGALSGLDIERAYFVSSSKLLDHLPGQERAVTWSGEALYRYVSSLPGAPPSGDLLQQCMMQEFYHIGASFIDKGKYEEFFSPQILQSRIDFVTQKKLYLDAVERSGADGLEARFDSTPDLEKPYFVSKMGWTVAERKERQLEEMSNVAYKEKLRADQLAAQLRQLQAERESGWKKKDKKRRLQEEATLRNLNDPRHVQKRQRQAKKRRRKGK